MKPLHFCCGNETTSRQYLNYIQIKDGTASATNANVLIRMPISEIFLDFNGETIVEPTEELYFLGTEWKNSKIAKAMSIEREGLTFTAFDRHQKVIGIIKALDAKGFTALNYGRYPDVTVVLPTDKHKKGVDFIGLNAKELHLLASAFGAPYETMKLTFCGQNRAAIVTHISEPGYGIIMPLMLSWETEPEAEPEPEPEAVKEDWEDLL
jgi:hypothetical protein